MPLQIAPVEVHPQSEVLSPSCVAARLALSDPLTVETLGRRFHVEWDPHTMHSAIDTILLFLTMVGEFGIVYAILFEIGSNRLERFLDEADSKENREERAAMYQAFINCDPEGGKSRREVFGEKLLTKEFAQVRQSGERLISILDRLANGLLHRNFLQRLLQRALRERAICWFPHVAVLVWEMLGPYVKYRRRISSPNWAEYYVEYSLECTEEIFRQWRSVAASERSLVVKDYSGAGRADYVITEDHLKRIQSELNGLRRR
jgi:hypothetical protein